VGQLDIQDLLLRAGAIAEVAYIASGIGNVQVKPFKLVTAFPHGRSGDVLRTVSAGGNAILPPDKSDSHLPIRLVVSMGRCNTCSKSSYRGLRG
jgi:hypothetical protein